jgi:cyclophilin family peptidyl-prolyl cis-trans isomerase
MPTNKRERQRDNRAKKLEERKKLERQKKLRKRATQLTVLVVVLAIALVVPTLFNSSEDTATTTTSTGAVTTSTAPPTTLDSAALPSDYDGYRAQPTACGAEAPPPVTEMTFDAPVDQGIASDATVTATITTSCGTIVAELDPAIAPETVNSFVFLAREGYFDGSVFHRIVPGFAIQGGDPTAIGSGGPGYLVADEFPEAGFTYSRGVLAMANAGANSTGSQFFIVDSDDAGLDPLYSVFGTVIDSADTIEKITSVQLTGRDGTSATEQSLPLETVYIEKVEIEVGG